MGQTRHFRGGGNKIYWATRGG